MNKELETKLFKTYPEIFPDGQDLPYGIECDDGWNTLLLCLFDQISHEIKNPEYEEAKFFKFKEKWNALMNAIDDLVHFHTGKYKFVTRKYLFHLYVKPRKPITAKVLQIKEKMGSLRVYLSGGNDNIRNFIEFATTLSQSVCEKCGKFDSNVDICGKSWYKSLCLDCNKDYKN